MVPSCNDGGKNNAVKIVYKYNNYYNNQVGVHVE